MNKKNLKIHWPNKLITIAEEGEDWFLKAQMANLTIPSGCLNGSCGACEIDVNGETIRACMRKIESRKKSSLKVSLTTDPFWEI